MELSSVLLKLLVCPVTGEKLIYDKPNKELISEGAGLAYPIIDCIPILLADKARKISSNTSKKITSSTTSLQDRVTNR